MALKSKRNLCGLDICLGGEQICDLKALPPDSQGHELTWHSYIYIAFTSLGSFGHSGTSSCRAFCLLFCLRFSCCHPWRGEQAGHSQVLGTVACTACFSVSGGIFLSGRPSSSLVLLLACLLLREYERNILSSVNSGLGVKRRIHWREADPISTISPISG